MLLVSCRHLDSPPSNDVSPLRAESPACEQSSGSCVDETLTKAQRGVQPTGERSACPLMLLELAPCAEGSVTFEVHAAAICTALQAGQCIGRANTDTAEPAEMPADGFYTPLPAAAAASVSGAPAVVCVRTRSPGSALSMSCASGALLPSISREELRAGYARVDRESAARLWRRELAASVSPSAPTLHLLCGPVQPFLPLLHRIASTRTVVRRAALVSGHMAVGLLLSSEQLGLLLRERNEAPVALEDESDRSEGQQRWCALLEESLVAQRALQSKLPAYDDHGAWEACWAVIRQHETEQLEPDELQEQQQRQVRRRAG